jgi:hypothetical protein
MAEKLDPEAKRLRHISPRDLADAIGALEARVEALKAEAIRRELRRAEGLTRPGPSAGILSTGRWAEATR